MQNNSQYPIFENTWDALRFSFYMEAIQAANISPTYTAIKHLMKSCGKVFERVHRRILLCNLEPMDVHAQCGVIRKSIEECLLSHEIHVIWCLHGVEQRKITGIDKFSCYCAEVTISEGDCLKEIVASIYGHQVSTREIAKSYGVSKHTVLDDKRRVQAMAKTIEDSAQTRIDLLFKSKGYVLTEDNLMCA